MTDDLTRLPLPCQRTLAALEQDPLNLQPEAAAHLKACPACAEARILWLAQADADFGVAPAGYFEQLPARVLRKLPAKGQAWKPRPFLWAAAALLLGAGTLGGFLAGRANRNPVVEATLPRSPAEVQELNQADTPFQEKDEVLTEMEQLTPEQLKALAAKLKATPATPDTQ